MKIIQIPFCFYPGPVGGTEIYVEALSRCLMGKGHEVIIAAPGDANSSYQHEGLSVRRFGLSNNLDLRELYGKGDPLAAEAFAKILDEENPDLVHLHAFTSGASLLLAREAKRRKIPLIFTYHTPSVTCQRGTLLRWGKEICDGVLNVKVCTQCVLQGMGVPSIVGTALSQLPRSVGRRIGDIGCHGRAWTLLQMPELIGVRHEAIHAFFDQCDHIVAVCSWVEKVLLINGVSPLKISISRQGLSQQLMDVATESVFDENEPLKMIFLGRLDPIKGLDILVEAVRSLPDSRIELHIYGIVQDGEQTDYVKNIYSLSENDDRIQFFTPVSSSSIVSLLKNYHLLAVPSQCLETGPLVVLEAFAAKIPVIGSDLGGISELIKDEFNGLLVKKNSIKEWARILERLEKDRGYLEKIRNNLSEPRHMSLVADEMIDIYTRV